jgi:hypothetical protein
MIDSLTPGKVYWARARANGSAGSSEWGGPGHSDAGLSGSEAEMRAAGWFKPSRRLTEEINFDLVSRENANEREPFA